MWSAGSCLMCFTMNVSLLLPGLLWLLVVSMCDQPVGTKRQESMDSSENHSTHLRGLWKLHMRDILLKGKGQRAPKKLYSSSFLLISLYFPQNVLSCFVTSLCSFMWYENMMMGNVSRSGSLRKDARR